MITHIVNTRQDNSYEFMIIGWQVLHLVITKEDAVDHAAIFVERNRAGMTTFPHYQLNNRSFFSGTVVLVFQMTVVYAAVIIWKHSETITMTNTFLHGEKGTENANMQCTYPD